MTVVPFEPDEAAAQYAYSVDQRIRGKVAVLKGMWIELAEDLWEFHQARLWADLGYDTFEKWLQEPEVELSERYVYNLLATWKQLVVERGVDPQVLRQLAVSKVQEVLPAIRRGIVTVDEGLADAGALKRTDLEERYRGKSSDGYTAGPDTSTEVRTEREPEWRRCEACGSLLRVTPGNGDQDE